jgi:hypothetical protein
LPIHASRQLFYEPGRTWLEKAQLRLWQAVRTNPSA